MLEAIYCYDRASVRFAVYEGGVRIVAEISEDALRDVFGARGGSDSLLEACGQHAPLIGARALEKHRASPGRPILLVTADFSVEHSPPA